MEPRLLRRGNAKGDGTKGREHRASMEPRLLRRGNRHRRGLSGLRNRRFNGATPSQTWKPLLQVRTVCSAKWLQWSHAFSDVETPVARTLRSPFGWLQWSHAFSDVETIRKSGKAQSQATASMEPRLLRRGNPIETPFSIITLKLQWSHAFSDVETASSPAG